MKIGLRKPNIKKSIKARTTGKVKRSLKSAVNPTYGKKGMGMLKDPEKAIAKKINKKTYVDPLKPLKTNKRTKTSTQNNKTNTNNALTFTKTITYDCKKWTFFILALLLGFVGAQHFYSGQKKKGIISLIFCWTGIPLILGIFQAFSALFKIPDENGNISIIATEKLTLDEMSAYMIQLLSEIEEIEPKLKTMLDPGDFTKSFKKITDNLELVNKFSKMPIEHPNFDSEVMTNDIKRLEQTLYVEEINFINRYHSAYNESGKEKIFEFKENFSPIGIEHIESIYK